ncbi:MAG: universal stress protein [Anaerolineae bacterium]|jgi:nucleotide-binding universal stress UspA family protein
MYKRILVPLDGSALAEAALPHAATLASRFDAEVILLRVVVSPYAIVAPDLVLAGYDPDLQALTNEATQYLGRKSQGLAEQGIRLKEVLCEGPVAEAILDHAVSLDVDLIVMSTHGRGGVLRWVYGSVADRVLQGATCPVLLIRVRETQE